jgi:polygalacturonase
MIEKLLLLCLTLVLTSCQATPGTGAPGARKTFSVREFGALADGKTKDTAAFQKALDAAGTAGGGDVVVQPGEYLIGSVVMPSNTTLRLEKDAKITGSPDKSDYPLMKVRWEGRWREGYRALIHAANAQNIAIVGPGMIAGDENLGNLRDPRAPCVFEPIECKGVRLDGFSVHYRRMWTIHLTYCQDVSATNLNIRSEGGNGDGIDVDSCRDVRIANCDIDTGDDAIAIKSGRGMEAVRIGRPTENVLVEDCTLGSSIFGCLSIGSETSGGIRNIKARRITLTRGATALYIKSRIGRGAFIEDVDFSDLTCKSAKCFLRIDLVGRGKQDEEPVPGREGIPSGKNFHFSNIKATCDTFCDAYVLSPEKPLQGMSMVNATSECKKGISLANIRDIELRDIHLSGYSGPAISASDVTGIGIEGAAPLPPTTAPATRP